MDTLDLYIKEEQYESDKVIYQFIQFTVNGKELPKIDEVDFIRSYRNTFNIELFTCGCGVAGCAGWFDGVDIKNRKHTVEWRLRDEPEQLKNIMLDDFTHLVNKIMKKCV